MTIRIFPEMRETGTVIVTCPECRTRYRYPQEDPTGPVRCRCSRCESTFVAGDVARSYLVVGETGHGQPEAAPATPVVPGGELGDKPAGLSIGMDDPTLAPRLQQTALDGGVEGGPEAALTYHIEVDDPDPEVDSEAASEPVEETEPEVVTAKTKRPGFGALLFVLVLTATFAAGGWQLAVQLGENPLNTASSTSLVGLLVGWLWVRWKYSRL